MTSIEAKCPNCNNKALVNEDMTEVNCGACSFASSYEDYLEIMKAKAVQMANDLQIELG